MQRLFFHKEHRLSKLEAWSLISFCWTERNIFLWVPHDDGHFSGCIICRIEKAPSFNQNKMITSILLFARCVLTILLAFRLFYRRVFRPLEVLLVDALHRLRVQPFLSVPVTEKNRVFTNHIRTLIIWPSIDTLFPGNWNRKFWDYRKANFKHLRGPNQSAFHV